MENGAVRRRMYALVGGFMLSHFTAWIDRKLGVPPGWGFPISLWAFAVVIQWVSIFLQMFFMDWLRTILAPMFQ